MHESNSYPSKYLLIAGTARMGKSLIRQKLLKHSIAGFCTDSLVAMLEYACPELGINFANSDFGAIRKYVQGLLTYQNNYPLVLEGVGVEIGDWTIYQKFGNVAMIGVGTCRISVEQKMQNIRQNPSFNEWTSQMSDLELCNLCQKLIQSSQEIQKQCEEFSLPFFDLSENFETEIDKVVEFARQYLGKK